MTGKRRQGLWEIVASVVFILCLLIKYCRLEDGEEKIDCQEIDEYGGLHCYETKSFSEPPSDHCLDWTVLLSLLSAVAVDSRNYNTILPWPDTTEYTASGKLEYIQTQDWLWRADRHSGWLTSLYYIITDIITASCLVLFGWRVSSWPESKHINKLNWSLLWFDDQAGTIRSCFSESTQKHNITCFMVKKRCRYI